MGRPKTIEDSELLAAARLIFRQHGHTATTRDVAQAAGISQAVLYQRFKSKDALFFAALASNTPALSQIFDIDATAYDPPSYLAIFAARTKDHFRNVIPSILHLATHPKYSETLNQEIHKHNRAGEVAALLSLRVHAWQEAAQIRPTNASAFAGAFLHALHSMAMIEVLSDNAKSPTKPGKMHEFVAVFWDGLKLPDSGRVRRNAPIAKAKAAARKTR